MRVCHITSMHDWDDDRIYQRACLGLARAGMEVHLVATRPQRLPESNMVNHHWVAPRSGWKRRWYSSKEAIEIALGTKSDIYHFHDPDILPHIGKIKRQQPHAKVVYDIHENYVARFHQWPFIPSFLKGPSSNFFRRFEIRKIRQIDGYSVVSDSLGNLFASAAKPNVVIRNTVDTYRLRSVDTNPEIEGDPIIYTSGSHSHSRNVLNTIAAMPTVLQRFPDAKMMFAGKYLGNTKVDMEAMIGELNLQNSVLLEGMLPWEDNFKRTAKSFCGCVFYAPNANNQVTIPNRIYEYMYCGIPVVASDYPELRKIVEDAECGVLVDADDPASIGEAIMSLLSNQHTAETMGHKGRKAIDEKHGYHIDIQNTISFYQELQDS